MPEKFKFEKSTLKKVIYSIIIIASAAAVICIASLAVYLYPHIRGMIKPCVTDSELDKLGLDGYSKLMIVAHPDDELLWGGAHLIEDDYFVVCVTNGYNKDRRKEFEAVMEKTGDKYLILSYTDKLFDKRSDWKYIYDNIESDINKIIDYKDWDEIVTHNKSGEYGHEHHKMVHRITVDCTDDGDKSKLRFFGKYYKAAKLKEGADPGETISDELLEKKTELFELYKTQKGTINKLSHMAPYENWTEYSADAG